MKDATSPILSHFCTLLNTHTKSRSFHKKNFTTMSCPLSLLHTTHYTENTFIHTNTRDKGEKIHNNTHYRNHYDIYTPKRHTIFLFFPHILLFFLTFLHTYNDICTDATKKIQENFLSVLFYHHIQQHLTPPTSYFVFVIVVV